MKSLFNEYLKENKIELKTCKDFKTEKEKKDHYHKINKLLKEKPFTRIIDGKKARIIELKPVECPPQKGK